MARSALCSLPRIPKETYWPLQNLSRVILSNHLTVGLAGRVHLAMDLHKSRLLLKHFMAQYVWE